MEEWANFSFEDIKKEEIKNEATATSNTTDLGRVKNIEDIIIPRVLHALQEARKGYIKVQVTEVKKRKKAEKEKKRFFQRKVHGTKRFKIFNARYIGNALFLFLR